MNSVQNGNKMKILSVSMLKLAHVKPFHWQLIPYSCVSTTFSCISKCFTSFIEYLCLCSFSLSSFFFSFSCCCCCWINEMKTKHDEKPFGFYAYREVCRWKMKPVTILLKYHRNIHTAKEKRSLNGKVYAQLKCVLYA